MNTHKLKPIVIALAGVLVLAPIAEAEAKPAPKIHEEVTTSPGRTISSADEQMLSTVAAKLLHRVSDARDAVQAKNVAQARQELAQADVLLKIIRKTAPTTVVKDRIWTTGHKLKYENTDTVMPASIPIYATLSENEDYSPSSIKIPVPAQPSPPKTGKDQKVQTAEKPILRPAELENRYDSMYYEELDLPINSTQHFITMAKSFLAKNELTQAADALQAALDNVDFISVYIPEPMLAAESNLARAAAHYKAGAYPEAKADVHAAIKQLKQAEKFADASSKPDVQQLLKDADSLQSSIDKHEPSLGKDIEMMWGRTKALADRTMDSTAVGWERLRAGHDPVRQALIEAKRYVAYADIDANVAQEPAQSRQDLVKAQSFLQQAEKDASGNADAMVYVKDAKAVVDSLVNGQAQPGPGEMHNLKAQLSRAIGEV